VQRTSWCAAAHGAMQATVAGVNPPAGSFHAHEAELPSIKDAAHEVPSTHAGVAAAAPHGTARCQPSAQRLRCCARGTRPLLLFSTACRVVPPPDCATFAVGPIPARSSTHWTRRRHTLRLGPGSRCQAHWACIGVAQLQLTTVAVLWWRTTTESWCLCTCVDCRQRRAHRRRRGTAREPLTRGPVRHRRPSHAGLQRT
jgi:hypothetical protein